ncbi:MAG: hypothetical protein MUF21_07225 [Gemmatimonadaceae bacterium]|nr:hypothetical protein [Gemmatimonadaceae bacterium]
MTATLETVSTLLGERARFEGWLRSLEAKRSTMPAHVVDRVRGDYGERLTGVLRELGTHVSALAAGAETLAARDATLGRDADARQDARAEAELRHAVGEYDDARWSALQAEHDGVLATLAEERRVLAGELATVRGLLAQAEDAQRVVDAGGPLSVAPVPLVAAPTPVPSDAPVDAAPLAQVTADAAADALAGTDDEPAPLPTHDLVTPPSVAAVSVAAVSELPPRATPPGAAPIEVASRTPAPAPAVAPRVATPFGSPAAPEAAVAAASPPSARPVDARKTLKCQECGTMNLPSEWYCEQCGAELAVF